MKRIHVEDRHLDIIRRILKGHGGAYVFGSRVSGKHRKFSDIDICFVRKGAVPLSEIGSLKNIFEESDLPFVVDITDYNAISEEFQKIIDSTKVPFPY